MSSVGLSEWVLLALIGLIVLGPERLPRIANQIGHWMGQARRMTRVMKRQLEDELDLEKANSIKPPHSKPTPKATATKAPDVESQPVHATANEDDDTFSPAHDAQSVGTGVADDEPSEKPSTSDEGADGDNEGGGDVVDEEKAIKP
jgi:sec-independent protein translocase protein TatB